ncbi:MAG: hypothetical protein ACKVRN_10205 [Pyrinomonadaceae bacterium]
MLEKIKRIPRLAVHIVSGVSHSNAKPILKNLCRSLRLETRKSLATLAERSSDLYPVHELHLAIDNLTNIDAAMRKHYLSIDSVGAESTLKLLNEQFEQTANLLRTGAISNSIDAWEIAMQSLNLLFAAKQRIKQEFGIVTALDLNGTPESAGFRKILLPEKSKIAVLSSVPAEIVLPAALLFQMRQSLFPAERMIVGAARKTNGVIQIEALFDVTGVASASGVKADSNRLGQALIAMAETETYFGLWVHSHPGMGAGATHPSGIDINQHADWLKDYSADLVSAIMVKDRYIRFWGTAVESGKVAVQVEGAGIECVSSLENIYRLGS